jgi:hypothetical protein
MYFPGDEKVRKSYAKLPNIGGYYGGLGKLLHARDQRRHKRRAVRIEERRMLDQNMSEMRHLKGVKAILKKGTAKERRAKQKGSGRR